MSLIERFFILCPEYRESTKRGSTVDRMYVHTLLETHTYTHIHYTLSMCVLPCMQTYYMHTCACHCIQWTFRKRTNQKSTHTITEITSKRGQPSLNNAGSQHYVHYCTVHALFSSAGLDLLCTYSVLILEDMIMEFA